MKTLRRLAFSTLIGSTVSATIISVETAANKVILNAEEAVVGKVRQQASPGAPRVIDSVKVGDVVSATVKAFADYGAFCELNDESRLKGIIHISELAWNRVGHPSTVLSLGQTVRVQVVSVDQLKGKVALSLRRTQPDPLLMSLDSVIDRVTSSGGIAQPLKDIESVCSSLRAEEGVTGVTAGRAFLSTAYASSLQLFLSGYKEGEGADGAFTVIARKEFTFQEVTVFASSRQVVKDAITRCATRMQ